MGNQPRTVSALLAEVHGAVDEVRAVAKAEHDSARQGAANWLDRLFGDVGTRAELRVAAKMALVLWGGMGSFSDANTREDGAAIDRLGRALTRARRSWFVREG
ncbi:hypothetical protein [Curtobacterium sp. TXMA1]|uniref:hypothetical protein n=1 Tax=Curtobacterium sp. TXMA1 TaxID=2876939 RepID=UPI001CCAE7FA|nr:hypothetical protein [Curtobacterium sp. TXMA1]UBQ02768.1 hypothetical protein LCG91_00935 [Curtobacterium sp. TXMA1]